jgi:hypothetical protein
MAAKFSPGRTVITPGALKSLDAESVRVSLGRHLSGDWGDLDPHDYAANERALVDGSRLLSAYRDVRGTTFWIITEADRSATTILLPEEY